MTSSDDLSSMVSRSLRALLQETMFEASPQGGFLLNPGDPGFVKTLQALSAETVSDPPALGRKPIVSHANHVLFGWTLINRALAGDRNAFEGANWDEAWLVERVTAEEWSRLLQQLEQAATQMLQAAPEVHDWDDLMLTGMFGSIAHTGYHLGAIRQMLKDLAADIPTE